MSAPCDVLGHLGHSVTRYDVWDTWVLGHSHGTLGTLQITYGTLGTLAWDTWDTQNYVWDTWDTHVGHYLNKYVTLCDTFEYQGES